MRSLLVSGLISQEAHSHRRADSGDSYTLFKAGAVISPDSRNNSVTAEEGRYGSRSIITKPYRFSRQFSLRNKGELQQLFCLYAWYFVTCSVFSPGSSHAIFPIAHRSL
jgi:hypothetical protein